MEEAAYLALIPQARNVAARYRLDDCPQSAAP